MSPKKNQKKSPKKGKLLSNNNSAFEKDLFSILDNLDVSNDSDFDKNEIDLDFESDFDFDDIFYRNINSLNEEESDINEETNEYLKRLNENNNRAIGTFYCDQQNAKWNEIVQIKDSVLKGNDNTSIGKGIFAKKKIFKNQPLFYYEGNILLNEIVTRDDYESDYVANIDETVFALDAENDELRPNIHNHDIPNYLITPGRYVNDPIIPKNENVQLVIENMDPDNSCIRFFDTKSNYRLHHVPVFIAKRDIEKDEELYWIYDNTYQFWTSDLNKFNLLSDVHQNFVIKTLCNFIISNETENVVNAAKQFILQWISPTNSKNGVKGQRQRQLQVFTHFTNYEYNDNVKIFFEEFRNNTGTKSKSLSEHLKSLKNGKKEGKNARDKFYSRLMTKIKSKKKR